MSMAPDVEDDEPRFHALLIGIDVYASGSPLGGCVNDIDAIQAVLRERLGVPIEQIKRLVAPLNDGIARPTEVPSERPTRAAILAELARLGGSAVKARDRVFIYYSGHGTHRFVRSPGDGVRSWREALVPTDNRFIDDQGDEKEQLLFDFELNRLLAEISKRTRAVTMVVDSCCSAGVTREAQKADSKVRYLPPKSPDGVFVLPADIPPPEPANSRGVAVGVAGDTPCMVVAACLDDETARESLGPPAPSAPGALARTHGELTRAILEQLASPALKDAKLSELRWGQIWRGVVDSVERRNRSQHPWHSSNPARLVFGGAPEDGDVGYAVTFDPADSTARIDAGRLMDVTEGAKIAVYPPMSSSSAVLPPLGSPAEQAARIGVLRVTTADDATAKAEIVSPPGLTLPEGARGRLIEAGEQAKLEIGLSPYDGALALNLKSNLVQIVPPERGARVMLERRADGAWAITDDVYGTGEAADQAVLPRIPAEVIAAAAAGQPGRAVAVLEHYYRYSAPIRMVKRCTERMPGLRMSLIDCRGIASVPAAQYGDPPLPELNSKQWPDYSLKAGLYDPAAGKWLEEGEHYAIRLESTLDQNLWVTLFYCDNDGHVALHARRLLVAAKSRATVWFGGVSGEPFGATLFPGDTLCVDRVVSVATNSAGASLDYLALSTSFGDALRGGVEGATMRGQAQKEIWTGAAIVLRMKR
jgi:hypothetical protein